MRNPGGGRWVKRRRVKARLSGEKVRVCWVDIENMRVDIEECESGYKGV